MSTNGLTRLTQKSAKKSLSFQDSLYLEQRSLISVKNKLNRLPVCHFEKIEFHITGT